MTSAIFKFVRKHLVQNFHQKNSIKTSHHDIFEHIMLYLKKKKKKVHTFINIVHEKYIHRKSINNGAFERLLLKKDRM